MCGHLEVLTNRRAAVVVLLVKPTPDRLLSTPHTLGTPWVHTPAVEAQGHAHLWPPTVKGILEVLTTLPRRARLCWLTEDLLPHGGNICGDRLFWRNICGKYCQYNPPVHASTPPRTRLEGFYRLYSPQRVKRVRGVRSVWESCNKNKEEAACGRPAPALTLKVLRSGRTPRTRLGILAQYLP